MSFATLKVILDNEKAVLPSKAHPTDAGYDLTAIEVHKKISEITTMYDTGLIVKPSEGFYTEIIPRSSISKTGYMLANSTGVIDYSYRGHILIVLTKVDESKPDLEVPFCKCQLVVRKNEVSSLEQVESFDEEKTERDEGGFGSTDKK